MDWPLWFPLGAVSLHITEEFLLPGGFPRWYRHYRADASRITPRFLFIVNAALLVACLNIVLQGRNPVGIAYWLTISALLCSNGCWHAWASLKSRSYSPGVVTGLAVYVPLAVYGYVQFLNSRAATVGTAVVAALIGGLYHFWSAAYHRAFGKRAG